MSLITSQTIRAPRILLTGNRIMPNGTLKKVVNFDAGNSTQIHVTNNLHVTKHVDLQFYGTVTVTMTSWYKLKGYSHYTQTATEKVGQFNDPKNINLAEIRYDLNKGGAFNAGMHIYKKPFTLKHNTSKSTYQIRARVFKEGKSSEVTQVKLSIK